MSVVCHYAFLPANFKPSSSRHTSYAQPPRPP